MRRTSQNAEMRVCLLFFSSQCPFAEKAEMPLSVLKIIHELDTKSKLVTEKQKTLNSERNPNLRELSQTEATKNPEKLSPVCVRTRSNLLNSSHRS